MRSVFLGPILALAAGFASAADPLPTSLVHGIFKPAPDSPQTGVIHPLPPRQKLAAIPDRNAFRVEGQDAGEGLTFPVLAAPGSKEAVTLEEMGSADTFLAPVDLTGCGVSDLIYASKDGWKVLTNGQRMAAPAQAFFPGHYEKGSTTRKSEVIPADLRDFKSDQDLLAAVGDFLGYGTEQLVYTRPGCSQVWVVGIHGVTALKADLRGIEATPAGARSHWFFPFKTNRSNQRTRIGYYRAGSKQLIRLVPKGMELVQEKVPLKGNWDRLSQEVLDWPLPAPKEPESK